MSRKKSLILLSCVLVAACSMAGCAALGSSNGRSKEIAAAVAKAKPCVVVIRFLQEVDTATGPSQNRITACGVLVSPSGLVMMSGSYFLDQLPRSAYSSFEILTDGMLWNKAEFIGKDEDTNLAFLKIRARLTFPCVQFEKDAQMALGQQVVTVGIMPEQFGYTTLFGTGRINAIIDKPHLLYGLTPEGMNALGTPVLTLDGKAIGILNSYDAGQIAARDASRAMGTLTARMTLIQPAASVIPLIAAPPGEAGAANKGWLGIMMDYLGPDKADYWKIPDPRGVIVTDVMAGSPAAKAGLRSDDIITRVNGQWVEVQQEKDLEIFREMVRNRGTGAKLDCTVLRQGKELALNVVLEKAPPMESEVEWYREPKLGITVRQITLLYAISHRLDPKLKGVLVTDVIQAGPAGLAGLEPGDVIRKVNDVSIEDVDDFRRSIQAVVLARDREILLFVQRGNDTALVNIRTEW